MKNASCWFLLRKYIAVHGPQNVKCRRDLLKYVFNVSLAGGWEIGEVIDIEICGC
jgi:hypothetical protein